MNPAAPLKRRNVLDAKSQILFHCQVREQGVVLKHVSNIAPLRRQADAASGVKQDRVVKQDAALIRLEETGERIECERFAGSAGAE